MEKIQKQEWKNETIITEFVLLGFGDLKEFQSLLFVVFLIIYIMTMTGNLLIILLVVTDQNLHTPMYFFLGNLSFLEICYSSTIIPQMLSIFLMEKQHVSVHGCILQLGTFGLFITTECCLLAVMSYDRYLAICRPLHYSVIMNLRVCLQLVFGSFFSSLVIDVTLICFILQLTFCGHNIIEHFYCEFTSVVELACNNGAQVILLAVGLTSVCTLPPLLSIIASYSYIIRSVLRIPTRSGRKKTFATCSSHLIVVAIFYGTLTIVYILPDTNELREIDKVFSIFYTILTPLVNPLIYSLRNKEVKEALRRTIYKCADFIKVL
ncbi:olfactory receptor 11A1-like [Candoia aspera]|uniref:olfactory receptor 11A1-like n=1 Tax=Candoia aspera TaxID=51853 RepID=UPI002FD86A8C